MKIDPDDPRERLKRARELRLKGREQEAAEAKKKSKFVSTIFERFRSFRNLFIPTGARR
jgi:hypothetical protein